MSLLLAPQTGLSLIELAVFATIICSGLGPVNQFTAS
jgi:hypothetical protein